MLTGGVTGTAHDTDSCSAAREPERPSLVGLGRAESALQTPWANRVTATVRIVQQPCRIEKC